MILSGIALGLALFGAWCAGVVTVVLGGWRAYRWLATGRLT